MAYRLLPTGSVGNGSHSPLSLQWDSQPVFPTEPVGNRRCPPRRAAVKSGHPRSVERRRRIAVATLEWGRRRKQSRDFHHLLVIAAPTLALPCLFADVYNQKVLCRFPRVPAVSLRRLFILNDHPSSMLKPYSPVELPYRDDQTANLPSRPLGGCIGACETDRRTICRSQ